MAKKQFSLKEALNVNGGVSNNQQEEQIAPTPVVLEDKGEVAEKKVRGPYNTKAKQATSAKSVVSGRVGRRESDKMDGTREERSVYIKANITQKTALKIKQYCVSHQISIEELIYCAVSEYIDK